MPGQLPEKCRAQQNSGKYLADNARLPTTLGYYTEQRRRDKYQRNLAYDVTDNYIHGYLRGGWL
jgi:hypothetical protein